MGELLPVACIESVPGDKFNISAEALVRFAPLIAPVMHRFDVSIHYFFVPNRILWPGWEEFITGAKLADGVAERAMPYLDLDYMNDVHISKLAHALGLPVTTMAGTAVTVNALPFAAYQKIYNEYYRDQNLCAEVDFELYDGNNLGHRDALIAVRRRAWEHDYFTAALPWAQKGEQVNLPIGDVALKSTSVLPEWQQAGGNPPIAGAASLDGVSGHLKDSSSNPLQFDPNGTLEVRDATITNLRRAMRLQEWLEKNARAGTRYVENILAHFGVKSSDARLQRPEYITGVRSPIVVSEVLNHTGQTDGLPQGNMAGHAIGVAGGKFGGFFCEEHGWIMGIMSVMPKPAYMQGVPKKFLKTDRLEYFWPSFAHIGEQEVLNKEIYYEDVNKDQVFGYVPRYAEYKYEPNRVAGDFLTSLEYWHMARKFGNAPALNQAFVECTSDDRIFAVEDPAVDKIYCNVLNKITAVRPMPRYGNPAF